MKIFLRVREKSQQDLFTKLKRMPINFLSLFWYKGNKIKNLIKHVKLKEKFYCLLIKIINQLAIMHMHNKNLIKHQLENVKF